MSDILVENVVNKFIIVSYEFLEKVMCLIKSFGYWYLEIVYWFYYLVWDENLDFVYIL